jgi:hypothetical protein
VIVSYGTTKLNSTKYGRVDLIIQNNERMADLGLPMAVRFDLSKANKLPWALEFFHAPEHAFYVVAGTLNAAEIGRLRLRLKRRGIIQEL